MNNPDVVPLVKTDVVQPVMGWDFQQKHRLSVDWTDWGDVVIIDRKNKIKSIMKYKAMSKNMVRGLSLLETEDRGPKKANDPPKYDSKVQESVQIQRVRTL